MRIWNLTPHQCNYDDGQTQRTIASDGNVRVNQVNTPADPIDGLATVRTDYGSVDGFPAEVQPGDVLIVSTIVADAFARGLAPAGVTVLVPDTGPSCKRDEAGRIVGVCQFIRK